MSFKQHYLIDNDSIYEIGKVYDCPSHINHDELTLVADSDAYADNDYDNDSDNECEELITSKNIYIHQKTERIRNDGDDNYSYYMMGTTGKKVCRSEYYEYLDEYSKIYICAFNPLNKKILVVCECDFDTLIADNFIIRNKKVLGYVMGVNNEFICDINNNQVSYNPNAVKDLLATESVCYIKNKLKFESIMENYEFPHEFLEIQKQPEDNFKKNLLNMFCYVFFAILTSMYLFGDKSLITSFFAIIFDILVAIMLWNVL